MPKLSFQDVLENIEDAVTEISDGEEIARIHNSICSRKVKYIEDNIWEYEDEED